MLQERILKLNKLFMNYEKRSILRQEVILFI